MVLLLIFYGPKPDLNTLRIIDETLNEELPELVRGKTGFAVSNNVRIWYELIPPTTTSIKGTICLLMSNAADALMWPPSFINQFASAGFQVIRLDYRGTGLSDWMSNWNKNNAYSLFDMAKDVIAVIDTLVLIPFRFLKSYNTCWAISLTSRFICPATFFVFSIRSMIKFLSPPRIRYFMIGIDFIIELKT